VGGESRRGLRVAAANTVYPLSPNVAPLSDRPDENAVAQF
jgi:hypothetical protein